MDILYTVLLLAWIGFTTYTMGWLHRDIQQCNSQLKWLKDFDLKDENASIKLDTFGELRFRPDAPFEVIFKKVLGVIQNIYKMICQKKNI
jgi:hypothetical protein